MARFYGFQPSEINSMAIDDMIGYLRAIEVISGGEKLDEVRVVSYPHMDKTGRDRCHREWHQKALPMLHSQPKRKVTLSEVAKVMGAKHHG